MVSKENFFLCTVMQEKFIMDKLIAVKTADDIPANYKGTPIGSLLEYHNLGKKYNSYSNAQMLIAMCMDNRKSIRIPENFAYVIRSGGGSLRYSEFTVSYAIALAKVKHIVLMGHDRCGMVNLVSKKEAFIKGLVENAGWERKMAEDHFMHFSPMFEIGNETDFVLSEARRLRDRYPKITIVPLFYLLDDNQLYLMKEE